MSIDNLTASAQPQMKRFEDGAGAAVEDVTKQARELLDGAADRAAEVYARADATTRGALRRAAAGTQSARDGLAAVLEDRPLLVAGVALGIGIVLGALLFGGGAVAYRRVAH
jgi:ElaB/YqjD/DUF883 family membrane-anchored ribosome-binding protein